MALDHNCNVYVANYSPTGGSLVRLAPDGSTQAQWGTPGHGAGQLERLEGVAVDAGGNVYAADSANGRVQKFSPDGQVVQVWGSTFKCRDLTVPCQVIPQEASLNGSLNVGVNGRGSHNSSR